MAERTLRLVNRKHTVCARCGADQQEERKLGSVCSAWAERHAQHLWTYPCSKDCEHA